MKFTRVRDRSTPDLVVNVLSADTSELLALLNLLKRAIENPQTPCLMVNLSNPNNRTIVINNEYFKKLEGVGCTSCKVDCPLRRYIEAHIIKWDITKERPKKPKTEKNTKDRFKIKVE